MTHAHATIGEYLAEHEPVLVLWHYLDGVVGQGEGRRTAIETLTEPAALIYLAGVFEGEVVKGGFRQFLSGPSGDFANATLRALRESGRTSASNSWKKPSPSSPKASLRATGKADWPSSPSPTRTTRDSSTPSTDYSPSMLTRRAPTGSRTSTHSSWTT